MKHSHSLSRTLSVNIRVSWVKIFTNSFVSCEEVSGGEKGKTFTQILKLHAKFSQNHN